MQNIRFLNEKFTRALILENPDPTLDERLREQGIEPERLDESATLNRGEVLARLADGQHDLIFKRSRFEVDEEVLQASKSLAAVMLCCIGDDSVDKQACAEHGVLVMNDPISNGRSVVELVFGELIVIARRIFHAAQETRQSRWTKDSVHRYELKGKTLSIIGLGNIGKAVAQMAENFDMDVVFYDNRELAREVGVTLGWRSAATMVEAFRAGDFVTTHLSAEDYRGQSNRGIISFEHLSQLGADRDEDSPRIFINAARGFLYEPEELKRAVREGHIRYASVDVFPEEPGSKSDVWTNPYADEARIFATPHIGAATREAQPRIARYVANTAHLFDVYGSVRDCVFAPGQTISVDPQDASYILTVVHSDARGTKKAVSDAIFEAGLNNLESSHRDFPKYSIAYDVSAVDRPLTETQLQGLIGRAAKLTGDATAIRAIRQIPVRRT